MKKSIKMLSLFLFLATSTTKIQADDRIYIDDEEICCESDAFWLHEGNNIWIRIDTIHRDETGLYTHECSIARFTGKDTPQPKYERSWKCPYCYMYWPLGQACKNENCPSRYK